MINAGFQKYKFKNVLLQHLRYLLGVDVGFTKTERKKRNLLTSHKTQFIYIYFFERIFVFSYFCQFDINHVTILIVMMK